MTDSRPNKGRRGRPRRDPYVTVNLNVSADVATTLDILLKVMDGRPTQGGIVDSAIRLYLRERLKDKSFREAYNAELAPGKKVISLADRTRGGDNAP